MRTSTSKLIAMALAALLTSWSVPRAANAATQTNEYHGSSCQLLSLSTNEGYQGGYATAGAQVTPPTTPPPDPAIFVCPVTVSTTLPSFAVTQISFSLQMTSPPSTVLLTPNCDMVLETSTGAHYVTSTPDTGFYPVDRAYLRCFVRSTSLVAINGYKVQMAYVNPGP